MRIPSIAVLIAGVVACAPTPSSFPGGTPNTNVITREDIQAANVFNAYDAVSRLRPQFLNSHGATSVNRTAGETMYPKVYLNNQFYGDITSLRSLDVHGITEIRYYSAPQASTQFGLGNEGGAIQVVTDAH